MNGSLPPGLTAAFGGPSITISGTPSAPVSAYSYRIYFVDSTNILAQTIGQLYTGSVAAAGLNCLLDTGNQGLNQTFSPSGGTGSFYFTPSVSGCTWTAASNASWMTIQGPASGTTAAGVQTTVGFSVSPNTGTTGRNATLTVSASSGASATFGVYQTAAGRTTLTVNCSTSAGPSQLGVPYSATCTGAGGTPPYNGQINGGSLPNNLTATSVAGGVTISGTPVQAGPYQYVVTITDSDPSLPQIAAQTFSGSVVGTPCQLGPGSQGLTKTFANAGGPGSVFAVPSSSGCSWNASVSDPSWVTLQGPTSGITTALLPITISFTVAANPGTSTRSAVLQFVLSSGSTLSFTIQQQGPVTPLSMTCTTAAGPGQVGVPYSATCTASGGTPPYSFVISNNSLPPGVSQTTTSNSITIAGTPISVESYKYIVSVVDSEVAPQSVSQSFSGTIIEGVVPCALQGGSLTPLQPFSNTGGSGVAFANPSSTGCSWTASVADPSWVTLQAPTSGTTTAQTPITISYTVAANPGPANRSTTLTITLSSGAWLAFSIQQQGAALALALTCNTAVGPTTVGIPYSATCTASGGVLPYSFIISNNPLPPGLQQTTTPGSITISGSPTVAESYKYIVSVVDSAPVPQSASQPFAGTIGATAPTCTLDPGPQNKVISLNPVEFSVSLFAVPSSSGCSWSASLSDSSWISFQGPTSGTTTAAVPFFVWVAGAGNAGTASRSTTLTFSLSSGASLSFVLQQPSQSVSCGATGIGFFGPTADPQGGAGLVNLGFVGSGCQWAINSNANWFSFSGAVSGVVSGPSASVGYTVQPNPTSSPRHADLTLLINGSVAQTASLNQNSATCSFSAQPQQVHLPAAGGPVTITVVASPPSCIPVMTTQDTWIGGSGQTNNVFSLFAPPNTGPARTATLNFGTSTNVTILQDAGAPGLAVTCAQTTTQPAIHQYFTVSCAAGGGVVPYHWTAIGTPPAGVQGYPSPDSMSYSLTGLLAAAGSFKFSIQVTDSNTPNASIASSQQFTGTVGPATLDIDFSPFFVEPLQQSVPFLGTCLPIRGTPPFQWTISSGALPAGLSLSTDANGEARITGTPANSGDYAFTLQLTDSSQPRSVASHSFAGTVHSAPALTCSPSTGPVSTVRYYSSTCSASGGTPPYQWSVTPPGSLPTGLTLTADPTNSALATISGTPNLSGSYSFQVTVADSMPNYTLSASQSYTGQIAPAAVPVLTVSPTTLVFNYRPDDSGLPPAQSLSVFTNSGPIPFTAVAAGGWLSVQPSGTTPGNVQVSANVGALNPGNTYSGQIVISAPGASPSSLTVPATAIIAAVPPAVLTASPQQLALPTVQGAAPIRQAITVFNGGGGGLSFTVQVSGGAWLQISAQSGRAFPGQPATFELTADPSTLQAGTYTGQVLISTADLLQTATIPVTLTVSPSPAAISIAPAFLSFRAAPQGMAPLPHSITVSNVGSGSMHWSATINTLSAAGWLAVSPNSGTTAASSSAQLSVAVDPSQLGPGTYYGLIQISAPEALSTQTATVSLTIPEPNQTQAPSITPLGLLLTNSTRSAILTASNFGTQVLTYNSAISTQDGGNWLSISPAQGSIGADAAIALTVQVDPGNLSAGVRQGTIRVAFSDGTVVTVGVVFVLPAGTSASNGVGAANVIQSNVPACSPSQLVPELTSLGPGFVARVSTPVTLEAVVVDDCANPLTNGNVTVQISTGQPAMALAPAGGGIWTGIWLPSASAPASILLTAASGVLRGQTQLFGTIDNQPSATAPVVTSILNSASYQNPNTVSAGVWFSIFGQGFSDARQGPTTLPYPVSLGGTRVLLGSTPLPLQFVNQTQINALVPFSVPSDVIQSLTVEHSGTLSLPSRVVIADSLPAIYTLNQHGDGQGAVLIANTAAIAAPEGASPGSRPAVHGEYVEIYATGLGPVANPPSDGLAAPLSPPLATTISTPSVTIGGVPAQISYSGLAPGQVGLYQINVEVPTGAPAGDAVPIVVVIDGKQSNTVSIAIR